MKKQTIKTNPRTKKKNASNKKKSKQISTVGRNLSLDTFKKAIKGSFGNITHIAKKLRCDRLTVYNWLEKHVELRELVNVEREAIVDLAESALTKNVKAKKETSVNFVLRTLGHKRGYKEKSEVDNNNFDISAEVLEELPNEYLNRIANGESPKTVIAEYYAVKHATNKSNG